MGKDYSRVVGPFSAFPVLTGNLLFLLILVAGHSIYFRGLFIPLSLPPPPLSHFELQSLPPFPPSPGCKSDPCLEEKRSPCIRNAGDLSNNNSAINVCLLMRD